METVRGDKVKAYTRSKAPLALMEQLIMILVFAAAAAVCVRAFVYASQLSKEGSDRQLAQNDCQTLTECLKAEKGNWQVLSEDLSMKEIKEGRYEFSFEKDGIVVTATETDSDEQVGRAHLEAKNQGQKTVYQRDIVWQK
ncbi:MAG: hypothetical protein ACLSCU_06175 [Eubacterium sp.]